VGRGGGAVARPRRTCCPARRHRGTRFNLPNQRLSRKSEATTSGWRASFLRRGQGDPVCEAAKPRFHQVAYDSPPQRLLFDLVGDTAPWPLDRVVELTERVRDSAAEKLESVENDIHNVIVGRRDAGEADKAARVRITPLASIGHRHADHALRRILVEIPPNCPLHAGDVAWAFSGLSLISDNGQIIGELAPAVDHRMLAHYGVGDAKPARLWRTVTPAALPQAAARRRIDPIRLAAETRSGAVRLEVKGGEERAVEECRAVDAVAQALRHSGVSVRPSCVRVQREPFDAKGARAEAFAAPPRFAKERLWHVEIAFAEPLSGPLILGDGRYLGLGLMAPAVEAQRDVLVFGLARDARIANADRTELLQAVRRALMALARRDDGSVSPLFSGHETDGAKAGSGHHRHIFLAAVDRDRDGFVDEVVIAAPWACDHTTKAEREERAEFDQVAPSLATIRAGRLGVILVAPARIPKAGDRLIGPGRLWESATPYQPTRHGRRNAELTDGVEHDVVDECARRGFSHPRVEILECSAGPNGGGVSARVRLHFVVAVEGPILIGRDSHAGGGLFETRSRSALDS
jgi:CRISPR-associated protein Csb2